MIRKNYSFFSQFLFTASASRCWSECSCNWKPICCPHVGRRLVCQKSVMSSQRRKGKVCCGSVLAGSWAVYRWFQDQKHLPQVCCHTAVLWCDFISIHVNFEFGASCPVLLLDSTIHQMDLVVVSVLQCVRREDSTSGSLRCLEFLQFLGQRGWWWVPLRD